MRALVKTADAQQSEKNLKTCKKLLDRKTMMLYNNIRC